MKFNENMVKNVCKVDKFKLTNCIIHEVEFDNDMMKKIIERSTSIKFERATFDGNSFEILCDSVKKSNQVSNS